MNDSEKTQDKKKERSIYPREQYVSDIRSILEGDAGVSQDEAIIAPIGAFDQKVTDALFTRSNNPSVPTILAKLHEVSKRDVSVPSIETIDMMRRYIIAGHLSHDSDPKYGALSKIKSRMKNATDPTVSFLYDLILGLHNTLESAEGSGKPIKIEAPWLAEQICHELMRHIPKAKRQKIHRLMVLDVLLHNKTVQEFLDV